MSMSDITVSVRCRCFEEGKLKPGCPVPIDDLFIDDSNSLAAHSLQYHEGESPEEEARLDELDSELIDWADLEACEHHNMAVMEEVLTDDLGLHNFLDVLNQQGKNEYPALEHALYNTYRELIEPEQAKVVLQEVNKLLEKSPDVRFYYLYDVTDDARVGHAEYDDSLDVHFGETSRKRENNANHQVDIIVEKENGDFWKSNHFTVTEKSSSFMRTAVDAATLMDIDSGKVMTVPAPFILPCPQKKEFRIENLSFPFEEDEASDIAHTLKKALEASIATGNPVRWM